MKLKKSPLLCLAALTLGIPAAHSAIITDFTSFTSATSNLLGGTNNRTQAFSTTIGVGTNSVIATATGGSGAGQALYLSEDYSLATVGSRISASLGGFAGTINNSLAIGLAVASSDSITSRENVIMFYYRFQATNRLGYATFGDTVGTPTAFLASNDPAVATAATPNSIFIERTATGYLLGTITGAVEATFATLNFGDLNVGGDSVVTADGTAVGIYSDVRNSNNVNTLTNFAHVPEPGAALLGGLGLIALLRRRR